MRIGLSLAGNHTSPSLAVVLVSYQHLQDPQPNKCPTRNRAVMVSRSTTAVSHRSHGRQRHH